MTICARDMSSLPSPARAHPLALRLALLGAVAAFAVLWPSLASAAGADAGAAPFPPPLDGYQGEEGLSLAAILARRVRQEPLNLIATACFLLAILHTFAAPSLLRASHRLRHRLDGERGKGSHSFRVEVLHFLGEIEAVFGIWCVPLLAVVASLKGPHVAEAFIGRVNFTEPLFVFVIMAISSTRPVLAFAEQIMERFAKLGGGTPLAWWLSTLTIGPLLGSFITEPAAMIICALLLSRRVFDLGPSPRLRYATLGLLFVNVSVGGTLTHFAAPPVLMVASRWGWDLGFMARHFGWKAVVGILASNGAFALLLRRELAALAPAGGEAAPAPESPVPAGITAVHLGFLALTVFAAHTPAVFLGGFLFFLAFQAATVPYQRPLDLRPPLLVGFFLAGLVVHGALQQWWIAPLLGRLAERPLFFGAMGLTAFNDNAAITYLASLVPGFGDAARYAVVAGAVAGGGLTVIANAPNPAGQSALAKHFPEGVRPLGLLAGAAFPTAVMAVCFLAL
ncbi:MAG TPA: putative Na+/H+ antiporter [Anaeromyxobacteraceae bacterium]|nr:putative Na+/H+ antiporter [Anaeromyxobacteraceae bacterium]